MATGEVYATTSVPGSKLWRPDRKSHPMLATSPNKGLMDSSKKYSNGRSSLRTSLAAKEIEVENEERNLTLQAVRKEVKMLEDENGRLRAEMHAIHDRLEGSRKQAEKMLESFQRWS
ncbi:hypothetical protein LTR64_002794 [Lithohypha guttulata]|uniref:Uncharacterized protein n=2 Tax=Lithohypha guttulata TaxID=1690604 RepID=A0AAN7T0L8_9EURO|nr:hypothetical protein LTR24_009677 [Lithohypha guttulata]KAK5085984.1 hypothetical protein LTR05_005274 [Lithohypha guttulata]